MPLKNKPGESTNERHSRHAKILKDLYELIEEKTALDLKMEPLEHHTYLNILQLMHTLNKAYMED